MKLTTTYRAAGISLAALAFGAAALPGRAAAATCADFTWASPPRIMIHEKEFTDDKGSAADLTAFEGAIEDVEGTFDHIGGTSAAVSSVATTQDAFDWGNRTPADPVPTIHFGWTHDIASLTKDGSSPGAITLPIKDTSTCTITSAYIVFPDKKDPSTMTWDYGTPFSTGAHPWYDAGSADGDGSTWFRPSFQHELLHAFGFHHLQGQYTFMTHRAPAGFPWANRAERDAVKLLPYEIGELRRLYPATGAAYDIALLNTWWGPPADPDDSAGGQYQLCRPSLGTQWTANDYDSGTCGKEADGTDGGTGAVCDGNKLRTRFTIANASTDTMDVTATLTFDRDDLPNVVSATSVTTFNDTVPAATSVLEPVRWTVPSLSSLWAYRPVVRIVAQHIRADGTADPASERVDSIPLSGTVRCGPFATPTGH